MNNKNKPDMEYAGFVKWLKRGGKNIPPKMAIRELQEYAITHDMETPYAYRIVDWYDTASTEGLVSQEETPQAYVKAILDYQQKSHKTIEPKLVEQIAESMDLHPRNFVQGFKTLLPEHIRFIYLIRGAIGQVEEGKVTNIQELDEYVEKTRQRLDVSFNMAKDVETHIFNENPALHESLELGRYWKQ